jgi:hypothetical protein
MYATTCKHVSITACSKIATRTVLDMLLWRGCERLLEAALNLHEHECVVCLYSCVCFKSMLQICSK